MLTAFVDHGLDLAVLQINALDRATEIVVGLWPRHDHVAGRNPGETAIVADIDLAVGPERGAVGTAGNFGDHLLATVGPDPGQAAAADFDQHHRAVRHRHRAFRKFEIGSENADIGHRNPPGFSSLPADLRLIPRTTISLRNVMAKSPSLANPTGLHISYCQGRVRAAMGDFRQCDRDDRGIAGSSGSGPNEVQTI